MTSATGQAADVIVIDDVHQVSRTLTPVDEADVHDAHRDLGVDDLAAPTDGWRSASGPTGRRGESGPAGT
jgi:hypothetical protein